MKITQDGNMEIIDMTVIEQVDDILKRLYQIENSLLALTPVIDIAYEYEERIDRLETEINYIRRDKMTKGMKAKTVKPAMKRATSKVPTTKVPKMPKSKPAGLRKAKR